MIVALLADRASPIALDLYCFCICLIRQMTSCHIYISYHIRCRLQQLLPSKWMSVLPSCSELLQYTSFLSTKYDALYQRTLIGCNSSRHCQRNDDCKISHIVTTVSCCIELWLHRFAGLSTASCQICRFSFLVFFPLFSCLFRAVD